MSDDANEFDIGYKRPPKHTRFQKGKSGNPRGRPRQRPQRLEDVFKKVMERPVALNDGRKITTLEALMMRLVKDAAAGDAQALRLLLQEARRSGMLSPNHSQLPGVLVVGQIPSTIEEWEKLADEYKPPKNPRVGLPGIPPDLLDDEDPQ